MGRFVILAAAGLALLLPLDGALAIVATPGVPPGFVGAWAGADWSFSGAAVYPWAGASAVAVSKYHLLTAGHVGASVGQTLVIGAVTYTVVGVQSPPPDPGQTNRPDLALLRLDKPLPRAELLYNGSYSSCPRPPVILIGCGHSGAVGSDSFSIDPLSPCIKRWGTNAVDAATRTASASFSSLTIQMNFNLSDTDYEAGYGQGDSGGGAFVKVGSQWRLAGINAYVGNGAGAGLYAKSYAVNVSTYYRWLVNSMTVIGDANLDLKVDFKDYQMLEANFGATTGASWDMGDFDFDSAVTFLDYQLFETRFGLAVPEPGALALLVSGVLVLPGRRASKTAT